MSYNQREARYFGELALNYLETNPVDRRMLWAETMAGAYRLSRTVPGDGTQLPDVTFELYHTLRRHLTDLYDASSVSSLDDACRSILGPNNGD